MAMHKDIDITIQLPPVNDKWSINICVAECDTNDDEYETTNWRLSHIQWKTYSLAFGDDVHCHLYDVWVTTKGADLFDLVDQVSQILINKL